MGKYGTTAVLAVQLVRAGCKSADEAWRTVASDVFASAPQARVKACPREAFLGLCQAGLIRGVPANSCTQASRSPNRVYATTAVRLLVADPDLSQGSKAVFWRRVMKELGTDAKKKPNDQLDVVLSLWERRLIDSSALASCSSCTMSAVKTG